MSRPSSQKRRPAILATSVAVLFSLGFLLSPQKASADQYWDGTTTGGSGAANGQGGSGTWDSSTTNWVDSAGNNPTTFDPSQTSIFSTTGGTITLGNDITFTTLRFDVDGYSIDAGGGPFKLAANSGTGTIVAQSGVTVTINPQLTGSGTMDFEGSGTIVLTSTANDYFGGTVIGGNGGGPTVTISSDAQLGAAGTGISFGIGTLHTTANITNSRPVLLSSSGTLSPDVSTTLELDGLISGGGTLVVTGSGTVVLGNTGNTYTGGTSIINGTLSISADGSLGGSGSNISFSGGTLITTNNVATPRSVTLNGTANLAPSVGTILEIGGQISGAGTLNIVDVGTVKLDATNNNYTGPTNVVSGTLSMGATNAFSGSSALTLNSGTNFVLNGFSQNVASLSGSGTVSTGGAVLTAGSNGLPTTFAGSIQGAGALTKAGTGTMTLTGTNTYTGRTTVNAGKLLVDPTSHPTTGVLDASSTLAMGGGAFQLNGVAGSDIVQKLNGLIVNAGQNQIIVNNLGTSTTLDLRGSSGTAGITRNGGSVDFSSATGLLNKTTAVIMTHQANDSTGVIGGWATVNGGADLAANDGNDIIVAYTGYKDIGATQDIIPGGN
ncbi:MAG TPA: autotransporter-associated beta strand repeat-containing protein, partial [Chthoniobacter sp.]|nr:autotransporter-associated beta strand repeat-containing protein [Chthoniobacter sp.]